MMGKTLRDLFKSVKSISWLSYGWIVLILSGAFYFRQVLNLFRDLVGKDNARILIWILFLEFLWLLIRSVRISRARLVSMLTVFAIGLLYAISFEIEEERVHLVKFGLLGWLVTRDTVVWPGWRSLLFPVVVGFIVSAVDESVQFFLPSRVGDPRDVLFGVIGSLWGSLLYLSTQRELR